MSTLFPAALAGMALAATPVIIYLLFRRRKTEVNWGASYLLRLTLTSKRKSSIWKQMVILAGRVLLLLLVALLVAQLIRQNPRPANLVPLHPNEPVHRVVLYDNSLSMTAASGSMSRQGMMREAVGHLLGSQQPADLATLIPLVAQPDAAPVIEGRMTDKQADSWEELASIPVQGDVDLNGAFKEAMVALANTPETLGEIYVFSDFPPELLKRYGKLEWFNEIASDRRPTLTLVNLATREATPENVVLEGLDAGTDTVFAGIPLTIYVDAVNYSDTDTTATLESLINGEIVQSVSVSFQPNERRSVPLILSFDSPGEALLTVKTDKSQLPGHGSRSLSLSVRDSLHLWLLGDDRDLGPGQVNDSEFIFRALEEANDKFAYKLEEKSLADIGKPIPPEVDVILLAGVGFGSVGAQTHLLDHVRRGGGIIFAMGPSVQTASYNDSYPELLPAPLLEPSSGTLDPNTYSVPRPSPPSETPVLFRDLATDRSGDFKQARVYIYQTVDEQALSGAVITRLGDGSALLAHRQEGRGHIYLLTTSLGISWTSLPVSQSYIPFLTNLLIAASSNRSFSRNLEPRERLVMPWPTTDEVQLIGPQGSLTSCSTVTLGDRKVVIAGNLSEPGLYRLKGTEHEAYATVRGGGEEGDLRTMPEQGRTKLSTQLGAPIHDGWKAAVTALGSADAKLAAWSWIVLLMLLIYGFECWFIRKI